MTTTLPILLAYNGSADADRALDWAAAEALRTGAAVRVVAVDEMLPPHLGAIAGTVVPAAPYGRDTDVIVHEAAKALADAGVAGVTTEIHTGQAVAELLRAADESSVVVLGSHGHGRTGEALLGSVSQHLARHATCPVVVVRKARDEEARRIVVGIDGSRSSAAALDYACRRAEDTGETVVAIHAWRVHAPSTDVWKSEPRSVDSEERELLLSESLAGVREDHPDVRLEHEVVAVAPGQALVDASAGASLVVVGSRGLGFFSGLLLGSVSQVVLHRAECPVAVVR
ncbi:nucleotide-binding universal stress UspA family protein [Nocardioides sp. BE266]|uniref:universal stress protein n=1 Tax=Nocardioides sp. BE266 TaxID=2817725 RepID=UPI002855DC1A|nr:universal stress protein [Nocardioides sp. BE266]MDR7255435.1 nucleotide-binding universal stress UspA family protein [Nocardioides sp. BE266]